MRRRAVWVAAGSAVGVAALTMGLIAGPAFAGNGNGTGSCDGTGAAAASQARYGAGAQAQRGSGARAQAGSGGEQRQARESAGDCAECAAAMGDLTEEQEADLANMVQEEKLAYDLYTAFAEQTGVRVFERIAQSEAKHMAAVRTLLERYGLEDPTATLDAGEFVDAGLAARYGELLAQGSVSLEEALAVGRAVEIDDIAELDAALDGLTAADVARVYENLRAASERHLAAFGG